MQKSYDGEEEIIGSDILDIEILKILSPEKRNDVAGVYHALVLFGLYVKSIQEVWNPAVDLATNTV